MDGLARTGETSPAETSDNRRSSTARTHPESAAPESASPRPEDVPEFDPAYTYSDWDGDEWEYLDGRWIAGNTHAERVAGRESRPGYPRPPERYGPYTRIKKENRHDH